MILPLRFQMLFPSDSPEVWMRSNKHSSRQQRQYLSPHGANGHSDNLAVEKSDRWRAKNDRHIVQSSSSPESADRRVFRSCPCPCANVNSNRVVRQPATAPATKKPPFVSYGCQYREREIGKKKTHNILAATDVSSAYCIQTWGNGSQYINSNYTPFTNTISNSTSKMLIPIINSILK